MEQLQIPNVIVESDSPTNAQKSSTFTIEDLPEKGKVEKSGDPQTGQQSQASGRPVADSSEMPGKPVLIFTLRNPGSIRNIRTRGPRLRFIFGDSRWQLTGDVGSSMVVPLSISMIDCLTLAIADTQAYLGTAPGAKKTACRPTSCQTSSSTLISVPWAPKT